MARRPENSPSRQYKETKRYKTEARLLGDRLRALRQAKGWTLDETEQRTGVDLKHWQKIESGLLNVTLVTLCRIAEGLDEPIRELFSSPRLATKRK